MPVRKIMPKTKKSLQPAKLVENFKDKYVQQAIQDLKDTLLAQQRELDKLHPDKGYGVGLASNQIEYPESDYPREFMPLDMYVVSVSPEAPVYT